MESRSNTLATVSLVCSIVLIVAWFGQMCVGIIPFIGFIALVLIPVEWILAIAGVITGILGWRTSAALDGEGRGPAAVGLAISAGWLLLQAVLLAMFFFLGVGFVFLGVLGAVLDS